MSCPSGSYTVSTAGTIADSAFENCDSLTSVIIGDSVNSIGNYAFYDCDSLSSVTIGDSVTSIGDYAFYCCGKLDYVVYAGVSVPACGSCFWFHVVSE